MNRSNVWKYFNRGETNETATCKICSQILKNMESTSSLWYHYKSWHNTNNRIDTVQLTEESLSFIHHFHSSTLTTTPVVDVTTTVVSQPPQKRLKRSHVSTAIKFRPVDKSRAELITQSICQMITMDMLPFSEVENKRFRKLMSVIEPDYKVPSRNTIIVRIEKMYDDKMMELKRNLENIKCVALTTDGWTSLAVDSYITFACHYFNENWELWISHDNAANITNAVRNLQERDIYSSPCAVHTLQLSINKGIENRMCIHLLKLASDTVAAFMHSPKRTNALENKISELGQKKLCLIQRCPTRWNSSMDILMRLLELRPAIVSIMLDRTLFNTKTAKKLEMLEKDWEYCQILVKLLKPLQLAMTVYIRPIVKSLIEKHLKLEDTDSRLAMVFKETVCNELRRRFNIDFEEENGTAADSYSEYREVNIAQIASLLDPRYKNLQFESLDRTREIIKQKIRSKIQSMRYISENENTSNTKQSTLSRPTQSQLKFLVEFMTKDP
ncbi:hypothetical protein QTP88_021523 [Uroleucon formosanum]